MKRKNKLGPVLHEYQGYQVRTIVTDKGLDTGKVGIYKGKEKKHQFAKSAFLAEERAHGSFLDTNMQIEVYIAIDKKKRLTVEQEKQNKFDVVLAEKKKKERRTWDHIPSNVIIKPKKKK